MKLAIMQPYFFPYIGYFQLINAVDKFVVYDDVTFIKKGWINRNRILINGKDNLFSLPLEDVSCFKLITDTKVHRDVFKVFKNKFKKKIERAYARAPFFKYVKELVSHVLEHDYNSVGKIAVESLKATCNYLNINTSIKESSEVYNNNNLAGQDRILDICKIEGASVYINLSGGRELYQKNVFIDNGIELYFIQSKPVTYKQFDNVFVPWLSIIDVLMFNSVKAVREMLKEYELL